MDASNTHFEYVAALYGVIAGSSLTALALVGLYVLLGASSCH